MLIITTIQLGNNLRKVLMHVHSSTYASTSVRESVLVHSYVLICLCMLSYLHSLFSSNAVTRGWRMSWGASVKRKGWHNRWKTHWWWNCMSTSRRSICSATSSRLETFWWPLNHIFHALALCSMKHVIFYGNCFLDISNFKQFLAIFFLAWWSLYVKS